MSEAARLALAQRLSGLINLLGLPRGYDRIVDTHWRPLAAELARRARAIRRPAVIGINGAQGSGKTTLCRFLEPLLAELGVRTVTLSLDDLYLTRAERQASAQHHHPLFATRGVPGTHDVGLGAEILDRLVGGRPAALPRFDKAADDRSPEVTAIDPPVDVILFEGWCVGAVPQPAEALREPVNRLESEEDRNALWRREANRRLATDYAALFARIDLLVMLRVEGFEAVRANRLLQERKLALHYAGGAAIMDEAALDRFLMHYERLTRWMLTEMPARADIVIEIGPDQQPGEALRKGHMLR